MVPVLVISMIEKIMIILRGMLEAQESTSSIKEATNVVMILTVMEATGARNAETMEGVIAVIPVVDMTIMIRRGVTGAIIQIWKKFLKNAPKFP